MPRMDHLIDAGRGLAPNFELAAAVYPDKPLTDEQLIGIQAEASDRYHSTRYVGDAGKTDLTALALMFGISHWQGQADPRTVFLPVPPEGSALFAYNLLGQMASCSHGPGAMALRCLSTLCLDVASADVGEDIDLVGSSFFAGLELAKASGNQSTAENEQLLAWAAREVAARKSAQVKRLATMAQKAAAQEQRLLSFATAIVASNPYASDRLIQRLYRDKFGLPENSSNAEAKTLARFRRSGALPRRRPAKTRIDDHRAS